MQTPSNQSYRLIPLTQGQFAKVDTADFDWLNQWKWYAWWDESTSSFRAVRNIRRLDGTRAAIKMHRLILGLKEGDPQKGDHAFHDTLDNRRFIDGKPNLRIASNAENCRNRHKKQNSKSPSKCVSVLPSGRYRVRICVDGERLHLGVVDTVEQGDALYAKAATKYHGDYACFE